jgi:hypothetical protein
LPSVKGYGRIHGADNKIYIITVGYSDGEKGALLPALAEHAKEQSFEFSAINNFFKKTKFAFNIL